MSERMSRPAMAGFSLIEVLVTMMILGIGLLGLAGLQGRAHTAETESFSRAKALLLVNEMADRIGANLAQAKGLTQSPPVVSPYPAASVTTPYKAAADAATRFGTNYNSTAICAATDVASKDLCEWDAALKGVTEGTNFGALPSVQGCIDLVTVTDATGTYLRGYVVSVAWAGRGAFGAAPADRTCGQGTILPEAVRRVVSRTVPIATLD